MFTLILGKYEDSIVDDDLVAILDAYNRRNTPSFEYAQELTTRIGHQLTNFENEKLFRYPSYLVYIFIFYQISHITHLNLQHHDQNVDPYHGGAYVYV